MIGSYHPGAVRLPFDPGPRPPHRFQPSHMRLGKILRGSRVMAEVKFDGIAPLICRCDFEDRAIDGARCDRAGRDSDDCTFRRRLRGVTASDADPMGTTVDAVDDEIVLILDLIGKAARNDPANETRWNILVGGIIDRILGGTARAPFPRHLAVQGLDDVTALTQPAQRRFHLRR
jgi:hypothetical protein